MRQHRYLILGGGVGKSIDHYLDRQSDTEAITVIDQDKASLEKIDRILGNSSGLKHEYIVADIDRLHLVPLFSLFDVVISALPAKYNFDLAKAAIEAGTNFCDLGGVVEITWKQIKELDDEARKEEVSIYVDLGLSPGTTNIAAKDITFGLTKTNSIAIYVGGLPQKPRPPLNYQRVFNLDGLASICHEKSSVIRDGKIIELEPFAEKEILDVPELKRFFNDGRLEAFITAGASIAPWSFKLMGIDNFFEKTVRWPGFLDFVKDIPREQFIEKVSPHINIPVTEENPDFVWMRVEVIGYKDNKLAKHTYTLLDLFDTETGLTAMERTTGFPTAITARMIANGGCAFGVNTPETAFTREQSDFFLKELNKEFTITRNTP